MLKYTASGKNTALVEKFSYSNSYSIVGPRKLGGARTNYAKLALI